MWRKRKDFLCGEGYYNNNNNNNITSGGTGGLKLVKSYWAASPAVEKETLNINVVGKMLIDLRPQIF